MKSSRWLLDEVFVKIKGKTHHLWRAVDHEGEIIEAFVTKARDCRAPLKFMRKLMKRHGRAGVIVRDKLRTYGAAMREFGVHGHEQDRR